MLLSLLNKGEFTENSHKCNLCQWLSYPLIIELSSPMKIIYIAISQIATISFMPTRSFPIRLLQLIQNSFNIFTMVSKLCIPNEGIDKNSQF